MTNYDETMTVKHQEPWRTMTKPWQRNITNHDEPWWTMMNHDEPWQNHDSKTSQTMTNHDETSQNIMNHYKSLLIMTIYIQIIVNYPKYNKLCDNDNWYHKV